MSGEARDIATTVLELANTKGIHRIELLKLALEILGAERSASLLWLWEEHWGFLVLSRYSSNVVRAEAPSELLDQVASPLVPGHVCPVDAADLALGMAYQSSVHDWARVHGFDRHELLLPVMVDQRGSSPQAIAFVQLLSSSEISPTIRRDVEIICGGIAQLITRSRETRRLEAIQELLQAKQNEKRIKDWLELAADKLIQITNAEAAMMFRETPDGYDAIVTRGKSIPRNRALASEKSVVTRVAERRDPVRLRDFDDDVERQAAFGTIEHDHVLHEVMQNDLLHGRVRSVLLAPILFEEHSLAVVALVNKKATVHLARIFSGTDQDVLTNVCGFLKGVLPSIELYEALAEMAKVVSPKTVADSEGGQQIYEVLRKMIPATTGVALIRRNRTDSAYTIDTFGGELSGKTASAFLRSIDKLMAVPGSTNGHHYITSEIPEMPNHYLTVELKRGRITGYETQILMFFARALSPILLAEQGREQVIETFAELRHAVRSGITGVVGYVNEARGCFELYRQMSYAPSVLSQSRFRKALERADFAAKKSSNLLDHSRFLLSQITRGSLKLFTHSLATTVLGVLTTLRPYADERRIEVSWNNQLVQPSDLAEFDRTLIELMIFNVVENAIKYSFRNRAVRLTLSGDRDTWELTVIDSGTPILEEDLETIFLPFERRPRGQAAEQRPGTGLGLAVARQIARAHGGDIKVSSVVAGRDVSDVTIVVSIPRFFRRRAE